ARRAGESAQGDQMRVVSRQCSVVSKRIGCFILCVSLSARRLLDSVMSVIIIFIRAAIEAESNLRVLSVTASLAIHAAELRRRYYSKKNPFTYNDGLYLATGLAEHADLLITTDPHL